MSKRVTPLRVGVRKDILLPGETALPGAGKALSIQPSMTGKATVCLGSAR